MRLLCLLICLPICAISQQLLDGDAFMEKGLAGLNSHQFYIRNRIHLPLVEEYSIRTETDRFDFGRQEYQLRMSPNSIRKRKAQRNLYNHIKLLPDMEKSRLVCERSSDLHEEWLDLYIAAERIAILKELQLVLEDKQKILEAELSALKVDVKDVLSLQTDLTDNAMRLFEAEQRYERLLERNELSGYELDFSRMIGVPDVLEQLEADKGNSAVPDPELRYEQDLLDKELALEKAEGSQFLDFIQLNYNGPHSDFWRERVSLGMAFEIQASGNRKLKVQEILMERQVLDLEEKVERFEGIERIGNLRSRIEQEAAAYLFYRDLLQKESEQLEKIESTTGLDRDGLPVLLLEMNERSLKMKLKSLSQENDILRLFIEYRFESVRSCFSGSGNQLLK